MNLLDSSQSGLSYDVNGLDVTKHSMMDVYTNNNLDNDEQHIQDYAKNAPKILLGMTVLFFLL